MYRRKENLDQLMVAATEKIQEREYWVNKLKGNPVRTRFPIDHKLSQAKPVEKAVVKFKITGDSFSKLIRLSNDSDVRLYIILLTILVVLLEKYTGNKDIIVGTTVMQPESDVDVNDELINASLALRHVITPGMTFKQLLRQAMQTFIESVENQNYPFEVLLEQLELDKVEGDFPLFDTAVLLENIHFKNYMRDISINMIFYFFNSEKDECIEGRIQYNPLLYNNITIERIAAHSRKILQNILSHLDVQISDIDILSEEEKQRLLYDFNDTTKEYPRDTTIHRLFEEQAASTPDRISVVFQDHQVTYLELNRRANQLAGLLREKGITANVIAAIMMEHSLEMLIGVLGILKAGGGFLPIDAEIPKSRIITMLEDSQTSLLLTTTSSMGKKSPFTLLQNLAQIRTRPHVTERQPQIKNLDQLPFPDRSLLDYEKYSQYIGTAAVKYDITMVGSRGCPYRCAYCHRIWPKTHVFRSAEKIFEEVQLYYKMGIRRFAFLDDIFNLSRENSTRFFQLILKNKLKLHIFFTNGLRGDILTKDYIDMMVEAGVIELAFALETACPRVQKLIGKNVNIDKMRENIEYFCEKYPHVVTKLQTMHGFPTETEEEAMMTLNFLKGIKWAHFPYVHILKVYPNTDMESLALENGIPREAIAGSNDLAFHELPDTLPFDKNFTLKYQAEFVNEYLLSKERLLQILPHQMKVFTEDELIQKYNTIFPVNIKTFNDILSLVGIRREGLGTGRFVGEEDVRVPGLNEKIRRHFPVKKPSPNALRVLLLDLSQFFSTDTDMLYDVVEPPLGLLYLMSYLHQQYGNKICGKVAKSRIDFDSYTELKALVKEFKPDVIGIRTLTLFKNFFHKTITMIKHWGINVPIIAGGPYASSDYESILQDRNVQVVVLGEGEITFARLIGKMLENERQLPDETVLKEIKGLAFVPKPSSVTTKGFAHEIIILDQLAETLNQRPTDNRGYINQHSDLAYVIFTSGSTGRPKGVMIQHQPLINLCYWHNRYYGVTRWDHATKYAGFSFDASIWEIFPYLIKGASLHIIKNEMKLDIEKLNQYFETHDITISFLPTQVCEQFIELDNRSLKRILTGGDKLQRFIKKDYDIYNNYGTSENTVVSTSCIIDQYCDNIPIGHPIDNSRIFIINKDNLQLQPIGVPGELCVAGETAAMGYLNYPELTQEKFILNPHLPGERLYRTGDLARFLPDGRIEFLGRINDQINLRGLRLEPGDIEAHLMKTKGIKKAVVVLKENRSGEKYICAYFVSDRDISLPEIREFLSRDLPEYMIPSQFFRLEDIPLTPNGKVDRKSLDRYARKLERGVEFVPPENEEEQIVTDIWKQILQVDKVGVNDNFFDLGGNSLKIIEVTSRINEAFKTNIPVVKMFGFSTVRTIGQFLIDNKEITLRNREKKFKQSKKTRGNLLKQRRGQEK
ncbi:MAG: AMP-binding protein [Candidatus Aminicenantes bacterium]|jgi:amino acid adenylation domain-containing protein